MNEIDNKNIEIIDTLVSKYFSLETNSLKIFKEKLRNPSTDPEIEKIFSGSQDLRVRYRIPDEYLEFLDIGWLHFKEYFSFFYSHNGISYTSFRNNKICYGGKTLKLKKALYDYYMENSSIAANFLGLRKFEKDIPEYSIELEKRIIMYLDKVGIYKLPSNGMEVVLSLNFADWFLCSTAEDWSSCLNLESNFHGAYWSGLPGLVTDKNRLMIYVTEGKKKDFLGIKIDSFLSRSWMIIDADNIFNILRFFPSEKINTRDINNIIKLPCNIGKGWVAKNPIDFLYFSNEKSSFAYLDYSKISRRLDGKFLMQSNKDGRFSYYDKTINKIIEGKSIFYFKYGFSYLVEQDKNLESVNKHSCMHCGKFVEENLKEFEDLFLCNHCYKEIIITCDRCGKKELKRKIEGWRTVEDGRIVCCDCVQLYYDDCKKCGSFKPKEKIVHITQSLDDPSKKIPIKKICKDCLKNLEIDYEYCDTCKIAIINPVMDDFIYLYNHETICKKCLRHEHDKGQYLIDFTIKEVLYTISYTDTIGNGTSAPGIRIGNYIFNQIGNPWIYDPMPPIQINDEEQQ
jgi:hypothetical protein